MLGNVLRQLGVRLLAVWSAVACLPYHRHKDRPLLTELRAHACCSWARSLAGGCRSARTAGGRRSCRWSRRQVRGSTCPVHACEVPHAGREIRQWEGVPAGLVGSSVRPQHQGMHRGCILCKSAYSGTVPRGSIVQMTLRGSIMDSQRMMDLQGRCTRRARSAATRSPWSPASRRWRFWTAPAHTSTWTPLRAS